MGERTSLARRKDCASREIKAARLRIEQNAGMLREKLTVKEMIRPLTRRVTDKLGAGGSEILETFRENPIPLTLAGVGIGWLILRDMRGPREGPDIVDKARELAESAGEKAGEAAGIASGKVSEAAGKVKEAAKRGAAKTSDWFSATLEENPMILAIGTLAIGIIAGLSIPVTEKEVETAGKVGEKLAGTALEKGTEVVEQSGKGAQETQRAAKGPEGEGSAS